MAFDGDLYDGKPSNHPLKSTRQTEDIFALAFASAGSHRCHGHGTEGHDRHGTEGCTLLDGL